MESIKKAGCLILVMILFFGCSQKSNTTKQTSEEKIPERLIQVWDQSKCEVCDDPWREWSEKIDDYTNLNSEKDTYDQNTMTAESYVLFKNVPLRYTEGYKHFASLRISYKYYSRNCTTNKWRDASIDLGTPDYWSEKNVNWIKKANNGDLFDVLMYKPEFRQTNPKHACDGASFGIVPANYDKIVVFPAGELNIKQTGNYKFKGAQGEFELFSENLIEDDLIGFDGREIGAYFIVDGETGTYFTDEDFYMIAEDIAPTEEEAKRLVEILEYEGFEKAGYLWIPDYKSLSGAEYYSVFIGPFVTIEECALEVERYRKSNPSAYGLLVSNKSTERVEIRGPGKITRK